MSVKFDFADKVAVVTGGAKGIGGSTSRRFLESGARVAIIDTDEEAGEKLAASFPDSALFIRCDVSKSSEVQIAFDRIIDRFGGVDFLVNNAGIQRYSTVTETSDEEWDLVMSVNLKSAFLCSRSAIPSMLKRGAGVVVNVSSVQAMYSQNKVAPYVTSKTAMLGLTRSIAVDYSPTVRCVAVCPGTVDTPMMAWAAQQSPDPAAVYREVNEMHLMKRIGSPDEVAGLILFLCSDESGFTTGQAFRIDGGLGIVLAGSKQE